MDQAEKQKQQCLSQLLKSEFHGKLTHLLLSVSVCSLFFSYPYWLPLLQSFNFNFHDSLPFQLFSHTLDKNCMFLVCNGLLILLVKNSGLIGSCSSSTYNDEDQSFQSCEDVPRAEENTGFAAEDEVLFVADIGEGENYDRDEEEEEEFAEGNGILSTEELNKRVDEFIAKMKQELRVEAGHKC
ncbi:hypothetical protein like AT3G13130 [Hibiscus trionum]|uniref:Uncharacterized protein n=1 Tax=Hibiscus trionum TaxID=183268 RepID=A0A9W7JAT5_HIBTR|nr:hypothetical protein like AT3G13130 [Hibiscus trionum]